MKGFVLTPVSVVDLMVDKLFGLRPPAPTATLLDPGCGTGGFIEGVVRWCRRHDAPLPEILGIESNPNHVAEARVRFRQLPQVEIRHEDFLRPSSQRFDYIIGNPPYVPITGLSPQEREAYRRDYETANGRFDLYLLFFEQALSLLKPDGRLVFITPEKFLYVGTASPLRRLLGRLRVEELHFMNEETFGELVTYPLVSVVSRRPPGARTDVTRRDGASLSIPLVRDGSSWLPSIMGSRPKRSEHTLADVCSRVSCGVATGADSVFIVRSSELSAELREFAHPTISGRHLQQDEPPQPVHSMLVPYSALGTLLPEDRLGPLRPYLRDPRRYAKLLARTCVERKPWYAFHENPPMREVLQRKILCKDIGASPFFVIDRSAAIIPRHSVYYIVPNELDRIDELAEYLNSRHAHRWLRDHCQRAANGFLRLQSHVLKRLPVPQNLAPTSSKPAVEVADTRLA
ncbi:MAG: Eco57I restriction-modification methylase domain-containing protein [Gemmatimonadaceae bacterium]